MTTVFGAKLNKKIYDMTSLSLNLFIYVFRGALTPAFHNLHKVYTAKQKWERTPATKK